MKELGKKILLGIAGLGVVGALCYASKSFKAPNEVYHMQNNGDHYSHTLIRDIDGNGDADYARVWRTKELGGKADRITVYQNMDKSTKKWYTSAMRAIGERRYHQRHPEGELIR